MYCDKRSPVSLKAAVAFNFDQLLTYFSVNKHDYLVYSRL